MKRLLFKMLPLLVLAVWVFMMVNGAIAQQKAVKFVDYNAASVSKPACFGSNVSSFATFTACTDMSATGLTTSGTVTANAAVLTTPLPVASGGTGTNVLFVTSIASAPTVTGTLAITGGLAYMATAVTGTTADWKQISN